MALKDLTHVHTSRKMQASPRTTLGDILTKYRVPLEHNDAQRKTFKPYLSFRDVPRFRSIHQGQRKLLLMEMLFFLLHGQPNSVVIYAGAAPCSHIRFLEQCFPSFLFILIDPAPWNSGFQQQLPQLGQSECTNATYHIAHNIQVYHGYFTDDLAAYLGRLYCHEHIMFISDIRLRTIESSSCTLDERNTHIQQDMLMQAKWFNILNSFRLSNAWAMFKFKIPYNSPSLEYLDGDLYYQPWAPLRSPELRLITNKSTLRTYDTRWLEEHLLWYNETHRNCEVHERDEDVDRAFNLQPDTLYEHDICKLYLQCVKILPHNTIGQFGVQPKVYEDEYEMMEEISYELGCKDMNYNCFCFDSEFSPNRQYMKKMLGHIIRRDRKYHTVTTNETEGSTV